MGFFKQMKEGWKKDLENGLSGFFKKVLNKFKEGIKPVPDKLQKYYDYWDNKKLNPETNDALSLIAELIDPKVSKLIVKKAKKLMEKQNDKINKIIEGIPEDLKDLETEDEAVQKILKLIKKYI